EFPTGYSDDQFSDLQVSSSEIPAEMRREMEKRQLQEEERRVEAAAAAYKRAIAEKGSTGRTSRARADSIQRRVQALLTEEGQTPVPRTAEGYGRYTDTTAPEMYDPPRKGLHIPAPAYSDEPSALSPETQ